MVKSIYYNSVCDKPKTNLASAPYLANLSEAIDCISTKFRIDDYRKKMELRNRFRELLVSKRYFAQMTDRELFEIYNDRTLEDLNARRANREVRKRAAKLGMDGPYEWLKMMNEAYVD